MKELNPKFTFFLCIGIIILCLFGFTHWQKMQAEEKDRLYQEKLLEDKKIEESYIKIIEPTIEPTVTPYQIFAPQPIRIDNSLSMNQYYTWYANNATGYKDMNVSITMYGFKELKKFNYYDYNWGKYFNEESPEGKLYFLAYVYIEMDNVVDGDDTRMYLPKQSMFGLSINNEMYYPVIFDYVHNQILDMDEIYNKNHVERIKPYGYEYIRKVDDFTKVKIPVMSEIDWLRAGSSNAQDGYIIFEIPEDYNRRMTRLHGNFFSFGSASWRVE